MSRRPILGAAAAAALLLTAAGPAAAKLPKPKSTVIVPGVSIAGVRLDMSKPKVFALWGRTSCQLDTCTWLGKGKPGEAERVTVSFQNGGVRSVAIFARHPSSGGPQAGALAGWKTAKGIGLGAKKRAVARAYPAAKPNTGEAVNGYDLFRGARPNLSYTRFSTPGFGSRPDVLHSIDVSWDVCHYTSC